MRTLIRLYIGWRLLRLSRPVLALAAIASGVSKRAEPAKSGTVTGFSVGTAPSGQICPKILENTGFPGRQVRFESR